MKIRDGFVTNSSSTNFIIISKEELTEEYLYKKLGFKENSPLRGKGLQLCQEILAGRGFHGFDFDELNFDNIKNAFGENTAIKYQNLLKKNYHVFVGNTRNESDALTSFFTCDSFIIDEEDLFLNGLECKW